MYIIDVNLNVRRVNLDLLKKMRSKLAIISSSNFVMDNSLYSFVVRVDF